MPKIHHTHRTSELRHTLDPHLGMVQRSETVHKASDTETITVMGRLQGGSFDSVPQTTVYGRDWDLSFDVPDDVAEHYVKTVPGWGYGPSPFAPQVPEYAPPVVSHVGDPSAPGACSEHPLGCPEGAHEPAPGSFAEAIAKAGDDDKGHADDEDTGKDDDKDDQSGS